MLPYCPLSKLKMLEGSRVTSFALRVPHSRDGTSSSRISLLPSCHCDNFGRAHLDLILRHWNMGTVTQASAKRKGFLELAPDTRNYIYEIVYDHHKRTGKVITVSSERGCREVPAAISRTCRQIREETLAYFYGLDLVTFVVRNTSDLLYCREWLQFVPEPSWDTIRAVRIKQTHVSIPKTTSCHLVFELALDKIEVPVNFWGNRQPDCDTCSVKDVQTNLVPTIDLILKDMCGGGRITPSGMGLIFDILDQVTVN